jgi:hypothetical protein
MIYIDGEWRDHERWAITAETIAADTIAAETIAADTIAAKAGPAGSVNGGTQA